MNNLSMEKIRLQFYLKCSKCGKIDRGTLDGEWRLYPVECSDCNVRMMPEIKTDKVGIQKK